MFVTKAMAATWCLCVQVVNAAINVCCSVVIDDRDVPPALLS